MSDEKRPAFMGGFVGGFVAGVIAMMTVMVVLSVASHNRLRDCDSSNTYPCNVPVREDTP